MHVLTNVTRLSAGILGSLLLLSVVASAQTSPADKTIAVLALKERKADPYKIIFDHKISKLILIDTAGTIMDNAVIGFKLTVRMQGQNYSEETTGSFLSKAMIDLLAKTDPNSIIFFEHIRVKDESGVIREMQNFQYNAGYAIKPEKKQ